MCKIGLYLNTLKYLFLGEKLLVFLLLQYFVRYWLTFSKNVSSLNQVPKSKIIVRDDKGLKPRWDQAPGSSQTLTISWDQAPGSSPYLL